MNLKNETGASSYLIAAIVISCAAPAGALNIWPRVEQMLSEGWSSHQFGIVFLVTMSALGMAAVPFAMIKAPNWGFWSVCLLTGAFLSSLNYALAVGAIGKSKDNESLPAETALFQSTKLKERSKALQATLGNLGFPKPTTQAQVETAREAVDLAKHARDQECSKVGDNCRARVAQLASRQSDLTDLMDRLALVQRFTSLTDELREVESTIIRLGSVSETTDPQARRLGSMLRSVGLLSDGTSDKKVADSLITAMAIAAEFIGLVLPRILVTALSPTLVLVAIGANSGGTTAPPLLPGPKATSKTAARSVPAGDWLKAARPSRGAKLECWAAYQQYKKWCLGVGTPVSYSAFQFELASKAKKSEEAGKLYFTF